MYLNLNESHQQYVYVSSVNNFMVYFMCAAQTAQTQQWHFHYVFMTTLQVYDWGPKTL